MASDSEESRSLVFNASPAFIEQLYLSYQNDPLSVEEGWRKFFEGYDFAANKSPAESLESSEGDPVSAKDFSVARFIQNHRSRGHLIADLNPIKKHAKIDEKEFSLERFGFDESDKDLIFANGNDLGIGPAKLIDIDRYLKKVYCGKIAYEFMNCRGEAMRQWIIDRIEERKGEISFDAKEKKNLLEMTIKATLLEDFLQTKYVGQKRFGLEGCEALIPGLDKMIRVGAKEGVEEFVFGMAHRGRLNVLVNVLQKSYSELFTEFEGGELPKTIKGDGDVKYHLGQSADVNVDGKNIHLSMAFNPSHLEAVNAVVEGMVQAKCLKYYKENRQAIVPVIIHGDAAVAGQGVVYELANLSKIEPYDNGGTLHVVIDNQVGFTANTDETRSGIYASDLAKITDSPVFHANADDVEAVSYAFELAMHARQKFGIDVWVNIIGFRKRGHNEGDEPRFTQPKMYAIVDEHPGLLSIYKKKLIGENVVTDADCTAMEKDLREVMDQSFDLVHQGASQLHVDALKRYWQDIRPALESDFDKSISTGVKRPLLDELAKKLLTIPSDFNLYKKLPRIFEARNKLYFDEGFVDWAMGEQLSFASILDSGRTVRLSGQDSARGTFAHRHAVLKDTKEEVKYSPLSACRKKMAMLQIINSQLSEYSILGFEYGYSLARPHALVIWEAQFGDFANSAQIVIDQFISSGESKWQRHCGWALLLPHGYEGMGPEHSSARLERFLQLCAAENMYVVNLTTPANLFPAFRRQVFSDFRKPLVIMSPKSLLRHPKVISPISDLVGENARFKEVIDDEQTTASKVKRVLMCSGKIYYELLEKREKLDKMDVAIVRIEQLYPLCKPALKALKKKYQHVSQWFWVQEEPANMGAWAHLNFYIHADFPLRLVSPKAAASTAPGMSKAHSKNQENLTNDAFAPLSENGKDKKFQVGMAVK